MKPGIVIILLIGFFICGIWIGFTFKTAKEIKELIVHSDILTNILAQQLSYEKSIANCKEK